MKADALSPRDLFGTTVHYEIPAFQRPYVWTQDEQWLPLWLDVRRVAEKVALAAGDDDALSAVGGHFLGAVVFKLKSAVAGDVTRQTVIDGQQRSTTLQILLDAVQAAVLNRGHIDEAEAIEELILNQAKRFAGRPERFKLWPSRSDRDAFEAAMEGITPPDAEHRIVAAHDFFRNEVERWLAGETGDDGVSVGDERTRATALADVVQSRLFVVAINLSVEDDDQLIFETLNDRGTPLLKADLIKNWVFQQGEIVDADTEPWADKYWADFDDPWWRDEISPGRHVRSRIDIFLQNWLTMRTRREVLTDAVFREFVEYARPRMSTARTAESLLGELVRDAATFRGFAERSPDTPEGRFYSRVVGAFDLASTVPILLWMASDNHRVPAREASRALEALESWVIRRALLRGSFRDVGKMMVSILGELDATRVDTAGSSVEQYLARQTSDSRRWLSDEEMLATLPGLRLYGNVRQSRLRMVLEAVELGLRSRRNEAVSIPGNLQVEHVMPRGWRAHWDQDPRLDAEQAAQRDRLVDTLGNLTLVTSSLNGTLSHRPWRDDEVEGTASGEHAGMGKRSLLNKYSVLMLSRDIVDEHPEAWLEDDIRRRGRELTRLVCQVWPVAEAHRTAELAAHAE